MTREINTEWGISRSLIPSNYQTIYQIIGFDRLNFVGDITNAIPQHENCHITSLSFECDGVRANGRLTVQAPDEHYMMQIDRRLRAVQGLVSIRKTN